MSKDRRNQMAEMPMAGKEVEPPCQPALEHLPRGLLGHLIGRLHGRE
jgi:hypothetical protein